MAATELVRLCIGVVCDYIINEGRNIIWGGEKRKKVNLKTIVGISYSTEEATR
jgi:hypothetical protein